MVMATGGQGDDNGSCGRLQPTERYHRRLGMAWKVACKGKDKRQRFGYRVAMRGVCCPGMTLASCAVGCARRDFARNGSEDLHIVATQLVAVWASELGRISP